MDADGKLLSTQEARVALKVILLRTVPTNLKVFLPRFMIMQEM